MKQEMNMEFEYIEFCPDAQGCCVGPTCGAFTQGLTLATPNGSNFVLQKLGININITIPMAFSLNVFFCTKYEKLIGKESANLYLSFIREVMLPSLL